MNTKPMTACKRINPREAIPALEDNSGKWAKARLLAGLVAMPSHVACVVSVYIVILTHGNSIPFWFSLAVFALSWLAWQVVSLFTIRKTPLEVLATLILLGGVSIILCHLNEGNPQERMYALMLGVVGVCTGSAWGWLISHHKKAVDQWERMTWLFSGWIIAACAAFLFILSLLPALVYCVPSIK